jgi:hypothetical protein
MSKVGAEILLAWLEAGKSAIGINAMP